jgi:hypothetical protein
MQPSYPKRKPAEASFPARRFVLTLMMLAATGLKSTPPIGGLAPAFDLACKSNLRSARVPECCRPWPRPAFDMLASSCCPKILSGLFRNAGPCGAISEMLADVAAASPPGARRGQGMQQPVGGGVQDQAHLVGARVATRGPIGRELCPVQLDEVLRLAARTIDCLIEILGRSGSEVTT